MFLLLLSLVSGCNQNNFTSCYEKSRDPAKCIRSSECIENELEVKLYSSRVHIKGFKVFDQVRETVKDLIGCDLKAYENCFNSSDIKTVSCLIDIDCLDFTDIGELSQDYFYNLQLEGYSNVYYQNPYQNTYQYANLYENQNKNNYSPQNEKVHHTENSDENNENIIKDEVGLLPNASDMNEDSIEIKAMSIEMLASKISEIYDAWDLAKAATETEKVKYKNFFDQEGNLINIDKRLEVLHTAYKKKIREQAEQSQKKTFEDLNAEKPKNPIPTRSPPAQPPTANTLAESFEEYLKQEDDINEFIHKENPKISTSTQNKPPESIKLNLEESEKEFETFWHTPTAGTNNLNKIETERSKNEDLLNEASKNYFEINQIDEENDGLLDEAKDFLETGQNQVQEDDSEFQPKLPNDDEDFSDENNVEYDETSEVVLQKKTEFLQENSCEEKCSEQCKTSENPESCTSQCIYDTCSLSKPATSDYITVIITGLLLFLVVSVIFIFIKSKGSRQVYDSYIKGHNA